MERIIKVADLNNEHSEVLIGGAAYEVVGDELVSPYRFDKFGKVAQRRIKLQKYINRVNTLAPLFSKVKFEMNTDEVLARICTISGIETEVKKAIELMQIDGMYPRFTLTLENGFMLVEMTNNSSAHNMVLEVSKDNEPIIVLTK